MERLRTIKDISRIIFLICIMRTQNLPFTRNVTKILKLKQKISFLKSTLIDSNLDLVPLLKPISSMKLSIPLTLTINGYNFVYKSIKNNKFNDYSK